MGAHIAAYQHLEEPDPAHKIKYSLTPENVDNLYYIAGLSQLSYNSLLELYKAVREEISRREQEIPIVYKNL